MCPAAHRIPYGVSLRDQCAHWSWQSVTPVPFGGLSAKLTGGFHAGAPCNAPVGAGFYPARDPRRRFLATHSVGADDPVAVPKISALPYGGRWKF